MFCTNCGKKVSDDAEFCPKCGGKISAEKISVSKGDGQPPRSRTLKIVLIFLAILAVLIIVPAIGYILTGYGPATYKHPTKGFSFTYYKSLKIETPTLPANATCMTAAPCLITLKNPTYDNYVVNWFIVMSAADTKVSKETFLAGAVKGFQNDVDAGIATMMTIDGKTVYKYESNSNVAINTIAVFAKMMDFNPTLQKTMYVFVTGDTIVAIFFTKPPAGAPGIYTNYLDISSLIIPQ